MYYSISMYLIQIIVVHEDINPTLPYNAGNLIRIILDLGYTSRFTWSPQPISSHNVYRLSISPLAK